MTIHPSHLGINNRKSYSTLSFRIEIGTMHPRQLIYDSYCQGLFKSNDLKHKHNFSCIISEPTGSGMSPFCILSEKPRISVYRKVF